MPKTDLSLLKFDMVKASLDHLVVIVFSQSSSSVYQIAVSIASGSFLYDEIKIGNRTLHCSVFAKTREDAARARALLQHIYGWKGVQIYAGGKLIQNGWSVSEILNCYLEASGCSDWRAHCQEVMDDPTVQPPGFSYTIRLAVGEKPPLKGAISIDRYLFPCAYLRSRFKFQPDHPSKPEDLIEAEAVKAGCDWCPNFNQSNYKKVGTRKVEYDVFS